MGDLRREGTRMAWALSVAAAAGLARWHRDGDGASSMAAARTVRWGSAPGGRLRGAGVDRGRDGEGEGGAATTRKRALSTG